MEVPPKTFTHLNTLLATDALQGKVTPCNDQIWKVTTETGQPPALAISTNYGLRAYGMRVFPRFYMNSATVTDARSFDQAPSISFQAANLLEMHFRPFPSINAIYRVWVPSSQVVVGQISLETSASQTESLQVEWVVMLEPFPGGTPMAPTEHGINTILCGKTNDLEPVFLLAGQPRSGLSSYPGLGLELVLRPSAPRQLTWTLASLEHKDLSFFTARRYSASSLEAEQLKLEVSSKKEEIVIHDSSGDLDKDFRQSQVRSRQLILPPFGSFRYPSVAQARNEDHGFSHNCEGSDAGPGWGTQTAIDAFLAARVFLPAHPQLVKGILQNLIEQQANNGGFEMFSNWNNRRSGRMATPLLAGVALDVFNYTQDTEWLGRVFPQLTRGVQAWFAPQDGTPLQWQHPLQTGMEGTDSTLLETQILLRSAESPALAALLWKECSVLIQMASLLNELDVLPWMQEKSAQLMTLVQSCWDDAHGFFHYRDAGNHCHNPGSKPLSYKRNGSFSLSNYHPSASHGVVLLQRNGNSAHPVQVTLFAGESSQQLNERSFTWQGETGYALFDQTEQPVSEIRIAGLKKGEVLALTEPQLARFDATALMPLWAGAATQEQCTRFLEKHLAQFLEATKAGDSLPTPFRWMLAEVLIRQQHKVEALQLLNPRKNFQNPLISQPKALADLLPLQIFLSLYGIEKWGDQEILLENGGDSLPPITVQYGQTTIEFLQASCKVTLANGETTTIDQAGKVQVQIA
jgi:hypothetical protein